MALTAREQLANIPVIANETARMVQALRSWPQSYWSRPTYCPGWTAADAVAHLATGGDFYAQAPDDREDPIPALAACAS